MPRFPQIPQILELMAHKEHIRNVSITAHIDHGKTTLTDHLLAAAGLLPPSIAGEARALDYLPEEQRRGITIKTANISLIHQSQGQPYLINLIDTPGHVDFTDKVKRALRATDGTIIIIDAVEEIMPQTETLTQQALQEQVKPVLYINKIDRLITELKQTPKQIQNKLTHTINNFNNLIQTYTEPPFNKQWQINPASGNATFGSALHKWGFTLDQMHQKGIRFTSIIDAYKNQNHQTLQKTLPLHNSILNMITTHIPNPTQAQKYRIPTIWKGNTKSEIGRAMLNCSDTGPTTMTITTIQTDTQGQTTASGRLFSGQIKKGDHLYLVDSRKSCHVKQVYLLMAQFKEPVDKITAGNIAAITGLNAARAGETLIDHNHKNNMTPFEPIRQISEPVITIALETRDPQDLPKLNEAMQRLATEDPNLAIAVNEETGQYLLSGVGELHLETALKILREYAGNETEITSTKRLVAYRETVTRRGIAATVKSPNQAGTIRIQIEPLQEDILKTLEKHQTTEETNTEQIRLLMRKTKWSTEQARKVWAIEAHKNILINETKESPQIPKQAKEMVTSAFLSACKNGPLCGEPMRGIKANLEVQVHENSVHREMTQIIPATKTALVNSFLTGKPTLLWPIYRINVSVPTQHLGEAANTITRKHGKITESEQKGPITNLSGFIAVAETFGLAAAMRSATSGHAFWEATFDHWEKLPAERASSIIHEIREKRGLRQASYEIP